MEQFALADRLGKTVAEIEDMTVAEFTHWRAYFKILNEKHRHERR